MCNIRCCKSTIKYTFSEIKYIDKLYTMYQFIILGLLFLFIVLHFYTDIKNYINTGNIIEGNDQNASPPATPATTATTATPATTATTATPATPATPATTATPATPATPTTPVPTTTPTYSDSNSNRGVCMGKISSLDSACSVLDNETTCNVDNKCNWASGVNNDEGNTWSTTGGQGEQEQYEQNFRRASSAPGIDTDGPCKPNCAAPRQPTGNCLDTPIVSADGTQKTVKLCPQICPYSSLETDNTHCKYDTDCKGCPLVEFDSGTKSDNPNRTDENKYFYQGKGYTPGNNTDSNATPEYTPGSGGWWGGGLSSDTGNNIIDNKVTQQVLEDKDIIPNDIDLNIDHATNFSRIGNNVISKIAAIRNLDIPTIDDNDKELLGRAYREVYEIKQGNDEVAIKAMETKFQQTVVYVLTQTKLESKSVTWDTPRQTSSLDSTTGMYDDNSNAFFAQGDTAKNKTEKPEGGLCLWNGCENTRRKPYDSIWSLY